MEQRDKPRTVSVFEHENDLWHYGMVNKRSNMLHNAVVDVIDKYRAEHGEPPPQMLAVYDYLHTQQIDAAATVKTLQSMYKSV